MDIKKTQLLQKFLDGTCTVEELTEVSRLLEHPETSKWLDDLILSQTKAEWESGHVGRAADVGAWKKQVYWRIREATKSYRKGIPVAPLNPLRIFRTAAFWIGLLLLSSLVLWQITSRTPVEMITFTNVNGGPVEYTLPDSSRIFLAAGSKLIFPQNFGAEAREVSLEGEGFFDVEKDAARPFIIHTHKLTTRVLGTSFKVKERNGRLVVSVATGKVSVSREEDKVITELALLTKGEQITFDTLSQQTTKSEIDVNILLQWKVGNLAFDNQRIAEITAELERRFAINIIVQDKIVADKVLSGTLTPKSVDRTLKTLSIAGKFSIKKIDSMTYVITKL